MGSLLLVAVSFYIFCAYVTLASSPWSKSDVEELLDSALSCTEGVFGNGSESWGQYSPYFPVDPYTAPPVGCEITQVNILQRHGARYPTKSKGKDMKAALKKIQSASSFSSELSFIPDFEYTLGKDDLVPFGAQESFDAGEQAFLRYAYLITSDNLPFVRASSSQRVVDSATNWTAGFAAASNQTFAPVLSVIISENGNDTLDDASCPALSSSPLPGSETDVWITTYTPNITAALNAGAPGADLDADDTQYLINMCPFVSVGTGNRSEWCDLFDDLDAFGGYEYWGSLDKYYNTGYGQPLGPVNGVGYINELLARLTDTPVNDSTSTNSTLDTSPATFPLGRALYADFTHDNLMIAVYAAMGMFAQSAPLSDTEQTEGTGAGGATTWVASKLVPFAARMVVERLSCAAGAVSTSAGEGAEGEYVRVLVNQAVQPLAFCGAGSDGVCSLDEFVESQAYARHGGDGQWQECFESS